MASFFDRLVSRIDKIDPASLQTHMRRLARERGLLETIFQSIQEGIMVLDRDGCLSYGNRAAERLLGFDAEKMRGHAMFRYLRDLEWEHLARPEPGGGEAWKRLLSREIEITYPEHRFLSVYITPLAGKEEPADDEEMGVLIILRDITRDRAQEASMIEGERFNAVKLLAAGVAHEIGNPLNALNIHLELLAREISQPGTPRGELLELVTVARNEVGRLDAIITQFLRALRPSPPQLVLGDIAAILRESLDMMRTEIENRRIEVSVANATGLPLIPLDPAQIRQVFFNLLKNAMEAMPDGGRIAIVFNAGDACLAVDIRDSGTGIAPDDFNRIFEPYHTTKTDGHGLGLMIVQRIIQEHGGQIEVASKPDSGTRFRLLLPLAERHIRKIHAPAQTDDASGGEPHQIDKENR